MRKHILGWEFLRMKDEKYLKKKNHLTNIDVRNLSKTTVCGCETLMSETWKTTMHWHRVKDNINSNNSCIEISFELAHDCFQASVV